MDKRDEKLGFFKSIQFKFVLIYTLLILLAMQLIGVYFTEQIKEVYKNSFQATLENNASVLKQNIIEVIRETPEPTEGTDTSEELRQKIRNQFYYFEFDVVKVINKNGYVMVTNSLQQHVPKQANKFIYQHMLTKNEKEMYNRRNPITGDRTKVLITPINVGQFGVLYIEKSMERIYKRLQDTNRIFAIAMMIALVVTAIIGVFLARTITKPLIQMRRQTYAVSHGDFSRKVEFYDDDEIGQLATSFNNMTDKLQEAQATTEAERKKLRSVLAYMTDGVVATNRDGHVILMNNRSEELLYQDREYLLGESIIDVLHIPKEYTVDDLYELEESMILDFSTEDQKMLVRANFSVIRNELDVVSGLIAVLHDITEQVQVNAERRQFVANASHELRTPLTTMKSYLEALSEGAVEDRALAAKFLGVTQKEVERMIRLVKDLLQLSKMDTSDYHFYKTRVNFVSFFENIIDRFEMSKEQNLKFKRELAQAPIFVEIEKDKMTQVIDNTISNAMKYSPEGGTITFGLKRKTNYLQVYITDEGVGIPKENLEKVFMRFYRVDKARSRKLGGTGLGLAIAKEIIAAHGGEIWAESEWNKGTTILFTLPLAEGGKNDDA